MPDQPSQGLFRRRALVVTAWRADEPFTCHTRTGPQVAAPGSWVVIDPDARGSAPVDAERFAAEYAYVGDQPRPDDAATLEAKVAAFDALVAEARARAGSAFTEDATFCQLVRRAAEAAGLAAPLAGGGRR